MRVASLALIALLIPIAGCLQSEPPAATETGRVDRFAEVAAGLPDIASLWDSDADTVWFEEFVTAGKRDAYTPDTPATASEASRDAIAARMEEIGLEVEVILYDGGAFGLQAGQVEAAAVIGSKAGTNPNKGSIAFVGHYDTQAGTIEGAYDNGSGTAAILSMCAILVQLPTEHGIECLLFDAEEVGTVASGRYVDENPDLPYDLVMGFDMIGLNCPGYHWKMYEWVDPNAAPWLHPFASRVTREVSQLDEECTEVRDVNNRNSDERNFYAAGYPTIRFSGGESAGAYDAYHRPDDTVEHIYELTGGRDNWIAGYANVVETAVEIALMFDPFTQAEIEAGL